MHSAEGAHPGPVVDIGVGDAGLRSTGKVAGEIGHVEVPSGAILQGPGHTGCHAGGVQSVLPAIGAEVALLHHTRGRIVGDGAVGTRPGAVLAAHANLLVHRQHARLRIPCPGLGRTTPDARRIRAVVAGHRNELPGGVRVGPAFQDPHLAVEDVSPVDAVRDLARGLAGPTLDAALDVEDEDQLGVFRHTVLRIPGWPARACRTISCPGTHPGQPGRTSAPDRPPRSLRSAPSRQVRYAARTAPAHPASR